MSQMTEAPVKTFKAASALAPNLRVKITSAATNPPTVGLAGATDASIGTVERRALAAGDDVAIRLVNAEGTVKMVSAGSITGGNPVYAAASGTVDASGTVIEGKALETAAANDVFEVLRLPNTDISATVTGTNAATFAVDADASTPKLALTGQSGGTGNFTTTLKPEATLSANNAIIVPEADGDVLVALALAQTLSNKTIAGAILTGDLKLGQTVTPVAAAGSTVADAAALPATTLAHITSDGATKGVKFAAQTAATVKVVINDSSTAAELYAASGGTVNGAAANASVVIPASKGVIAFCTGADTWIVFDLPAKSAAS